MCPPPQAGWPWEMDSPSSCFHDHGWAGVSPNPTEILPMTSVRWRPDIVLFKGIISSCPWQPFEGGMPDFFLKLEVKCARRNAARAGLSASRQAGCWQTSYWVGCQHSGEQGDANTSPPPTPGPEPTPAVAMPSAPRYPLVPGMPSAPWCPWYWWYPRYSGSLHNLQCLSTGDAIVIPDSCSPHSALAPATFSARQGMMVVCWRGRALLPQLLQAVCWQEK